MKDEINVLCKRNKTWLRGTGSVTLGMTDINDGYQLKRDLYHFWSFGQSYSLCRRFFLTLKRFFCKDSWVIFLKATFFSHCIKSDRMKSHRIWRNISANESIWFYKKEMEEYNLEMSQSTCSLRSIMFRYLFPRLLSPRGLTIYSGPN